MALLWTGKKWSEWRGSQVSWKVRARSSWRLTIDSCYFIARLWTVVKSKLKVLPTLFVGPSVSVSLFVPLSK